MALEEVIGTHRGMISVLPSTQEKHFKGCTIRLNKAIENLGFLEMVQGFKDWEC